MTIAKGTAPEYVQGLPVMPTHVAEPLHQVKRVTMRLAIVAVLCGVTGFGCTDGLRGVRMETPKPTGQAVVTVTTSESDGLRVLWNGKTAGEDFEMKAWIAGDPDELAAVWRAAAVGPPPPVDFGRYIVIARAGMGWACNPKIVGLDAEASGLLTLRYDPPGGIMACILTAPRVAHIVAVPRRALTATVVFLDGYAFQVPEIPFG